MLAHAVTDLNKSFRLRKFGKKIFKTAIDMSK